MVQFDLKVLAKFGLCSNYSQKLHSCCNCSHARILVKVEWTNGTLKYGVREKFNSLKIPDLQQLNTYEKHSEIILLIFLQISVKFKESTQWYKLFLRSNGHSNGCLPEEAEGTTGCKALEKVEPSRFCTYCSVLCELDYQLLLGAKQRILLIKERFRLAENLLEVLAALVSVFF